MRSLPRRLQLQRQMPHRSLRIAVLACRWHAWLEAVAVKAYVGPVAGSRGNGSGPAPGLLARGGRAGRDARFFECDVEASWRRMYP